MHFASVILTDTCICCCYRFQSVPMMANPDLPPNKQSPGMEPNPAGMFHFYKWTTFVSMYVGYTLTVLNRKSFSFALPAIIQEGLDKDDLGNFP